MNPSCRFYLLKLLILLTVAPLMWGTEVSAQGVGACEERVVEVFAQSQSAGRDVVPVSGQNVDVLNPMARDRREFEAKKAAFEKYVEEEGLMFADPVFAMIVWEVTKDANHKDIVSNFNFRNTYAERILEKLRDEYLYYALKNRDGDDTLILDHLGENAKPMDLEELNDKIEAMTFYLSDGELYGLTLDKIKYQAQLINDAYNDPEKKRALIGLINEALEQNYSGKIAKTTAIVRTTRAYNRAMSIFGQRSTGKSLAVHLGATAVVSIGLTALGFANPGLVSQFTAWLTGPMVVRPDLFAAMGGSTFLFLSSVPSWLPAVVRRSWRRRIQGAIKAEENLIAGDPNEVRSLSDFQRQIDFATDLKLFNQSIDSLLSYKPEDLQSGQSSLNFMKALNEFQTASYEVSNDIRFSHLFHVNQDISDGQSVVSRVIAAGSVDRESREKLNGFISRFTYRLNLMVSGAAESTPDTQVISELKLKLEGLLSHVEGLKQENPYNISLTSLSEQVQKMVESLDEYHEIYANVFNLGTQLLGRIKGLLEGDMSNGRDILEQSDAISEEANRLDNAN